MHLGEPKSPYIQGQSQISQSEVQEQHCTLHRALPLCSQPNPTPHWRRCHGLLWELFKSPYSKWKSSLHAQRYILFSTSPTAAAFPPVPGGTRSSSCLSQPGWIGAGLSWGWYWKTVAGMGGQFPLLKSAAGDWAGRGKWLSHHAVATASVLGWAQPPEPPSWGGLKWRWSSLCL